MLRSSRRTAEACVLIIEAKLRRSTFTRRTGQALLVAAPLAVSSPTELVSEAERAVLRASRLLPFSVGCLERAMTLHRLLERRGITTLVRVGIRQVGSGIEAHAWLEHGDRVLTSSPEHCARYEPLRGASAT